MLLSTILVWEHPSFRVVALLAIAVLAFARAYYFAFYVIEHYIDPNYKHAGLFSFLRYLARRRNFSLLLNPDLNSFTSVDLVRVGFVVVPAQGQQVLGDFGAELFQCQVVQIIAEGVLDFDADLLDAEEGVSHAQDRRHREPTERIDQCKWKREAIENQHAAQVDHIGIGERSRMDALAGALPGSASP
jgi:hypothetical protein